MARKILLADDSVTAQNMGRKILADAGYEVVTVNNGSAALKKIAEWKPELIILDVYMPGYSGLEVCQRLKDAQETARVPVLLSVGKLEPFKPDEARRVRADGYIVKPFEASELLSALSKLEDKIVPKAEAGKPGRLGRSVAGIGDSNSTGDEPVAEGSWKSRISLPGKKKETAEESPDAGDIYNSVNRDLKTVVAHDEAKKQGVPAAQAEESQAKQDQVKQDQSKAVKADDKLVDLGALATAGLPKDVTTEEINALAAAVAQVQGKRGEAETASKPATEEIKAVEKVALPEIQREAVAAQSKQESSAGPATPTEDEVLAAIARLEQEQERGPEPLWNPSLADDAGKTSGEREDLPVTMAAPAMAQSSEGSRWTAVSVGVDPQEAALSLEREMQQAFRDFTSAAAEQAGPATLMAEAQMQPSEISAATIPAVTPEAVTPEAVTELLPAVDSATEVKAEQAPATSTEVLGAASGAEAGDFAVARGEEISDHSSQPDYAAEVPTVQSSVSSENLAPETAISETVNVVSAESQTPETVDVVSAEAVASQEETLKEEFEAQAEQAPVAASSEVTGGEVMVSDVADTMIETQAEPAVTEAPASEIVVVAQAEVTPQAPQNNESEMAATTAAAWASWRQIRDSVPAAKSQSVSATEVEHTQESAPAIAESALAVAAGAESIPSEAAVSVATVDSQEVASIVDNLLAELRPRIVEEISRKLAAKK